MNDSVYQVVGKLRLYNNDILVSLWVGPDGKNSDQYIVQVKLVAGKRKHHNILDSLTSQT